MMMKKELNKHFLIERDILLEQRFLLLLPCNIEIIALLKEGNYIFLTFREIKLDND
jgi:hypothetical protein